MVYNELITKTKPSFYNRFCEFKNRFRIVLRTKWSISIICFLLLALAAIMFAFNIFYKKETSFLLDDKNEIVFDEADNPILVTKYFRAWSDITKTSESLRIYLFSPIAKILVSISIPIAGYAIQITTQNKLSSPSTLGYVPASILAYICTLAINPTNFYLTYVFGFIFSSFVILIKLVLQHTDSTNNKFKPVLIGFAISALISTIGVLISILKPNLVNASVIWTGELANAFEWEKLYVSAPLILACTLVFFILSPKLKIMQKDFILAKTLGINTKAVYWTVAVTTAILCISTITISSPVFLLGLIIPNIVKVFFDRHDPLFVFCVCIIFSLALNQTSLFISINHNFSTNLLIAIIAFVVLLFMMRKRT
ncbi:iron chelate uptake ABC transporter family permease subunit [Ureaplasma diversum]|uniref:ABC transporter, permease component n=1 Tax=Ureaplasma diversum NCTC 246 TaxID=1188241 RepID=A0A084F0M9_9BACT|nr:iron chelate uptake ABC transporter family permease subunit [Ureaplasma diversum]KEZ23771.1 ABC transporter, permease component [Ureaplasma diversum NCTC 246]